MRETKMTQMSISHEEKFHDCFIQLLDVAIAQHRRKPESTKILTTTFEELYESAKSANKKISQLIAKSWMQEGKDIRDALLNPPQNLKKGESRVQAKSDQIKALLKKYKIEVVEELEKMLDVPVTVLLNPDSFAGYCTENIDGIIYSLPYPARPSDMNVDDATLKAWVNDTDSDKQFPENLYIPLSWC